MTSPAPVVLVTLSTASTELGHPERYFRVRRSRFLTHPKHAFPLPKGKAAGADLYDLKELTVWDERRKQRPRATRQAAPSKETTTT